MTLFNLILTAHHTYKSQSQHCKYLISKPTLSNLEIICSQFETFLSHEIFFSKPTSSKLKFC